MNRDLQTQLPFAFKGCLGEWCKGRKAEDGGKGEWLSLEVFLAFEWTSGNSLGSFKPYDGSHIPIVVWGSSLGGKSGWWISSKSGSASDNECHPLLRRGRKKGQMGILLFS